MIFNLSHNPTNQKKTAKTTSRRLAAGKEQPQQQHQLQPINEGPNELFQPSRTTSWSKSTSVIAITHSHFLNDRTKKKPVQSCCCEGPKRSLLRYNVSTAAQSLLWRCLPTSINPLRADASLQIDFGACSVEKRTFLNFLLFLSLPNTLPTSKT